MKRLQDKVAIVTGSARGLGRAFCLAMTEEGANVVINYRYSEKAAQEVVKTIQGAGSKAIAVKADIAKEEDVEKLIQTAINEFGRIDILVNNAAMIYGIGRKPFYEISTEEWDALMAVNLRGLFLCCKAVFPQMKKQNKGKIINLSSETAFTGSKGFIHYVTSKGGIISFTRSLASECGLHGICVNAIAPGFTDTESSRTITDDINKYDVSLTPLGRLEQPKDLVGALIFLASDESNFITGQTLVVDGGRYMH